MNITALITSIIDRRPTTIDASGEVLLYTGDLDFAICLAAVLITAFVTYIAVRRAKTR